jgi:hypothetical protein
MQSRLKYVIYSEAYEAWLNKMADGLTQDMFKGISFPTLEDAEEWMMGIYAPKDSDNYEIQRIKNTMEVVEDEHLPKVD